MTILGLFNDYIHTLISMLKPTSHTLIWEKKNKGQTEIENNNTIKIDFSKMSQVAATKHPFTRCQCGALFIEECVESEGVGMKKKQSFLSDMSSEKTIKSSQPITWICKFCKKNNKDDKIYVCPNNSKFILQDKIERQMIPPILLFVIDYSGSMQESISVQLCNNAQKSDTKLTPISSHINKMIEESQFYKKNSYKEKAFKEEYNQYLEQYKKDKQEKGEKFQQKQKKFYSKITFFMAVIESYISKITKQQQNQQFRVGFIFFNQSIFLMKPTKQNYIPVITSSSKTKTFGFPFKQSSINFNSYQQLFEQGQKYDRFFGDSRMKKMDMYRLQVENISTQGQTALGPALALALGVASKHDIGSRVILISDVMPNIGLLSSSDEESNEQVYEQFEKVLKTRKISLGVLNWIDDSIAKQQIQSKKAIKNLQARLRGQFHNFLSKNKDFIKEITIDFSIGYDQIKTLDLVRSSIGNLLSRAYLGEALQIQIFKDNERLNLTKFKYDNIDFRFLKFLNTKSKNWIQYQTSKAKQMDFLFPIITQIVVTYEDIFTKQKYLYMSYIKQKLIKISSQEQKYEYLQNGNMGNIRQLLDMQNMIKFDRENVLPESYCSKGSQLRSMDVDRIYGKQVQSSIVCESLNQLAEMEIRCDDNEQEDCYL